MLQLQQIQRVDETISRSQKENFLLSLREDDFRATAVIPLFTRLGMKFLRDTHGNDEEGKDCIFTTTDPLGFEMIYAVQTKKGHLTMSRKAEDNLFTALTQLRTALATNIVITDQNRKTQPHKVILCVSGKINVAARKYIQDEIGDSRITFYDIDNLIPEIDKLFPEFWFGIDADKFPYLQRLRETILSARDVVPFGDNMIASSLGSPIADESYVPLYLTRFTTKFIQRQGDFTQEPQLKEIPATAVLGEQQKLILIIGEGGGGKTTALRRIAYKLASDALATNTLGAIPVILKATDVALSETRLVKTLAAATSTISPGGKESFSANDLKLGNVVALIDGLDEVPNEREKVLQLINEFHLEYPKCKVVLTSRDYSYIYKTPLLQAFAHFRLGDISFQQAAKIVANIVDGRTTVKSASHHAATEMLRRLQDLHGISLTPFLVTVFASTSDFSKKDIPPNITEIFKKLTEQMLGKWDDKRSLSQQYEAPLKDFLLQNVAFKMHSARNTSMRMDDCRRIFKEELEKRGHNANGDALFDEVVYRSGILIVEDDLVRFRNHLLQEYFAGRGVPSPSYFKEVLAQEWWRNPTVFYFGDHPDQAHDLLLVAKSAIANDIPEQYTIAVTAGLAIQASYLSEVDKKAEGLMWVVEDLANTYHDMTSVSKDSAHPINDFLAYYLCARDAIACTQIVKCLDKLGDSYIASAVKSEVDDARFFWLLVGLLESGNAEKVVHLLRSFKPTDSKLQLGLHLSAFHISRLRVTNKNEKKFASDIVEQLTPKVRPLISQLWKEFRGILLEMRQGTIRVIEHNSGSDVVAEIDI